MEELASFHEELTYARESGFLENEPGGIDGWWVFGFDTAHSYNGPEHDEAWVRKMAKDLADCAERAQKAKGQPE